jgi:hypothetical protein
MEVRKDNIKVYPPNLDPKLNWLCDEFTGTARNLRLKIKEHFDIIEEVVTDDTVEYKVEILVAKIDNLKKLGWTIPETITDMRVPYISYVENAISLERMGIDWYTVLMNNLIDNYLCKN